MYNLIINLNWQLIGTGFLFLVVVLMLVIFRKKPLLGKKALILGCLIFVLAFIFNITEFIIISDFLFVLGYVVSAVALSQQFLTDTKETN